MLSNLLQHSMWNQKHHPLFCKCQRSAGLNETDGDIHQCIMLDDDEFTKLFYHSKRRFEAKKYEKSKHHDWCDMNNVGVTHFGIYPALFNVSTIRFDVFHCTCAVHSIVYQ